MENLRNCPFCGYEHVTVDWRYGIYYIVCPNCQSEFSLDCTCGRNQSQTKTEAAWNRRADGWIAVTERLPDKTGVYDVWGYVVGFSEGSHIESSDTCRYYADKKEWDIARLNGAIVTHWMERPQPPKKGG